MDDFQCPRVERPAPANRAEYIALLDEALDLADALTASTLARGELMARATRGTEA